MSGIPKWKSGHSITCCDDALLRPLEQIPLRLKSGFIRSTLNLHSYWYGLIFSHGLVSIRLFFGFELNQTWFIACVADSLAAGSFDNSCKTKSRHSELMNFHTFPVNFISHSLLSLRVSCGSYPVNGKVPHNLGLFETYVAYNIMPTLNKSALVS